MSENTRFVAIDLETATRFRGSICEIGIAVVENGEIVEARSWFVRPRDNRYDYFNIAVHGITPEMTADAPDFKDVWQEVVPYLDGNVVVAHNSSFDMYALKDALDQAGLPLPKFEYYCSLRISRKTFPGLYSYSLPSLCAAIGVPFDTHHRAENDAIGCAGVFIKCLDKLAVDSPDEIPQKLPIHKGVFDGISHIPQRHKDISKYRANLAKTIVADESKVDTDNYFYGKVVCFTGTFSFASRKDLLQAIADIGGIPADSVTRTTNVLVVGQQDYRIVGTTGISSKQKKAMALIEKGQDLEIMSEKEFLANLGV